MQLFKCSMMFVAFLSTGLFFPLKTWANDDCLERLAKFADQICGEVDRKGAAKVVDASGNLNAGVKGLITRFIGGVDGGLSGKISTETYENVLREQLGAELFSVRSCRIEMAKVGREEACKVPVRYQKCRHPDFGRVGWEYTEEFPGSSGWRRGGTSQPDWCRELANSTINNRSIGRDHEVSTVTSGEDAKWTWDRHRLYNYSCTVRIKWGPIYAEKEDAKCGVVQPSGQ